MEISKWNNHLDFCNLQQTKSLLQKKYLNNNNNKMNHKMINPRY